MRKRGDGAERGRRGVATALRALRAPRPAAPRPAGHSVPPPPAAAEGRPGPTGPAERTSARRQWVGGGVGALLSPPPAPVPGLPVVGAGPRGCEDCRAGAPPWPRTRKSAHSPLPPHLCAFSEGARGPVLWAPGRAASGLLAREAAPLLGLRREGSAGGARAPHPAPGKEPGPAPAWAHAGGLGRPAAATLHSSSCQQPSGGFLDPEVGSSSC